MKAYQAVDKDLPGEIVRDAAIRRDHRHSMEERAARVHAAQVRLGQVLAFALAVVGFAASIYARHLTGSTVLAIVIAAFGVGAPITVAFRRNHQDASQVSHEFRRYEVRQRGVGGRWPGSPGGRLFAA